MQISTESRLLDKFFFLRFSIENVSRMNYTGRFVVFRPTERLSLTWCIPRVVFSIVVISSGLYRPILEVHPSSRTKTVTIDYTEYVSSVFPFYFNSIKNTSSVHSGDFLAKYLAHTTSRKNALRSRARERKREREIDGIKRKGSRIARRTELARGEFFPEETKRRKVSSVVRGTGAARTRGSPPRLIQIIYTPSAGVHGNTRDSTRAARHVPSGEPPINKISSLSKS